MTSHKGAVTVKNTIEGGSFAVMTSHNAAGKAQNSEDNSTKTISLYHKCLDCPDYGVSCNGPKLAALGDIMDVRAFHRAIRNGRNIPMKLIYLAAPTISEATINDYFSHSVKDFKWTTVGSIDNALTLICGNRVGQPPLDHPCPASSTEIREQFEKYENKIELLKNNNAELQSKVTETKGKVIATREEVKEDYASRVLFLKELCEKRQKDIDAMEVRHQQEMDRMDALAANYLARIDEKNQRLDRQGRSIRWLTLALVVSLIALTCYLVWDLVHPTVGLIQW